MDDSAVRGLKDAAYRTIARRIGVRLRNELDNPEADPLPAQHVDLLLRLRHKERDRSRARAG